MSFSYPSRDLFQALQQIKGYRCTQRGFQSATEPCICVGASVGLWLEPTHHHIQSSVPPTPTSQTRGAESPDPPLNHCKRGPVEQSPPQQVVWSQRSLNICLWAWLRELPTGNKPVMSKNPRGGIKEESTGSSHSFGPATQDTVLIREARLLMSGSYNENII